MMSGEQQGVPVRVLDQEYVISCTAEERQQLLTSASLVNQKINELRESNKVLGNERLLVLAVLNIANELLLAKADNEEYQHSLGRVAKMQKRLEGAFASVV